MILVFRIQYACDVPVSSFLELVMSFNCVCELTLSLFFTGELNGVKYSAELTAADCFELGRQSYNNGDYYHTWLWMKEAEGRLNKEKNETISQSDILEYLAFSIYKQGDLSLALDLTNKLLEIMPTHSRAMGNKVYYEAELVRLIETQKKKGDDESEEVELEQDQPDHAYHNDPYAREYYESLCRGETNISEEIASKLKCRYV